MEFDFGSNIRNYINKRRGLYRMHSQFSCSEYDCDANCCRIADSPVEVNLFDMISVSYETGELPSDIFRNHCLLEYDRIGLEETRLAKIKMVMKNPCDFLKDSGCSVYMGRPMTCALFPEHFYTILTGWDKGTEREEEVLKLVQNEAGLNPCTAQPLELSQERMEVLRIGSILSTLESGADGMFMFGDCNHRHTPFSIDLMFGPERIRESLIEVDGVKALTGDAINKMLNEVVGKEYYRRIVAVDVKAGQEELFDYLRNMGFISETESL